MPRFPLPDAAPAALHRRATPPAPSTSPSNDANVALVAIIASASFISLLMLVCVCRSLRRHPTQPGCLHWFLGRSAPRPAAAHHGTAAAAGTGPRRLSVIQDEITREYYRRSAIMAVAGPRGGGPVGFNATTGWDPTKPPSEVYTPPPAYLPDRPISYHELPMAASSASQAVRSARSSVLRDPLPESPAVAQVNPLPFSPSASRRTRPQTIDDVLGLAASSPEFRAADMPPPAYAPFSDIPLVDMMDGDDDDNLPLGHGAGRRSYHAGHVHFAQQHGPARHHHHHHHDHQHRYQEARHEHRPRSNLPTSL